MSSWNILSVLVASCLVAWTDIFGSLFPSMTMKGAESNFAFLDYFDDSYNYMEHPTLNTLKPYTREHLWSIIMHPGINVYEPVSSVIKAILIDLIGFDAHALHIASMIFHSINLLLLWCWVNAVIQNDLPVLKGKSTQSFRVSVFVMIAGLFFYVHPLNMEVIGWLSAQGYTYSLSFSLLSSLAVEQIISNVRIQRSTIVWEIIMTFTYVIACLCKAPAVVLPGVHITRMAFATVFRRNVDVSLQLSPQISSTPVPLQQSSRGWMVLTRSLVILGMVCCVLYRIISQANDNAGAIVPPFESWISTIIRSIATIANFSARIWIPIDLRGHYRLQEEHFYSWDTVFDPTTDLFWKLWIVVSFTFITAMQCLSIQSSVFVSTIPLGWCWFLLLWLPGCGLVAHGWALLGSDRYNYFPLAYIAPSIVHLLLLVTNDDRVNSTDVGMITSPVNHNDNSAVHGTHINNGQQTTTNGNKTPSQHNNQKNNAQQSNSQSVQNQQLPTQNSRTSQNINRNNQSIKQSTKKTPRLSFADILYNGFIFFRRLVILFLCGMYLIALARVSRVQVDNPILLVDNPPCGQSSLKTILLVILVLLYHSSFVFF